MGRPPQLEVIENSPTKIKRIKLMNRVKNYYKKNDQSPSNFSGFKMKEIDKKLRKISEINFKL